MLVKEYVGPEMKGFDPAGELFMKFLRSIGRAAVSVYFLVISSIRCRV